MPPVAYDPNSKRIRLTKLEPEPSGSLAHLAPQSKMEVSFSVGRKKIVEAVRTIPRPGHTPDKSVKSWKFMIEADDEGNVFLEHEGKRFTSDTATEEILAGWLFGD
jgi:hypothetical protein